MAESSVSRFTAEEFDQLSKYFIGNNCRYRENIIVPRTAGPVQIKSDDEKRVEDLFQSCAFKSLTACVVGSNFLCQIPCFQTNENYFNYMQVMDWVVSSVFSVLQ